MKITHPKDFFAGLMFFAFGLFGMVAAFEYPLGTAARMGPGYFPRVLGGILMLLGAALAARSFALKGGAVTPFAWKAIGVVLGAVAAFGAIVTHAGLVVATTVLIVISGLASREFNLRESLISSAILSVVAVLLFIVGLGLQFPIFPWSN
jgi:putative tricarboxylic transport membrane protein